MQYSTETKNEALALMLEGMPIKDIHEYLGVSMSTLYRWQDEHSKVKQTSTSSTTEELVDRLLVLEDFKSKVVVLLHELFDAKIKAEIKEADTKLSEVLGTFSENVYRKKIMVLEARSKLLQEL